MLLYHEEHLADIQNRTAQTAPYILFHPMSAESKKKLVKLNEGILVQVLYIALQLSPL